MKKYGFIILLLFFTESLYSSRFSEAALSTLIRKSELIVYGVVINKYETDKFSRSIFINETYKKRHCWVGSAAQTAEIKIISVLKGETHHDTILIPYNPKHHLAIPNFFLNDSIILFLNPLSIEKYYGKSDARSGIRFTHINKHVHYINSYLEILNQPKAIKTSLKFEWFINLACDKHLTRDGSKILRLFHDSLFNDSIKQKLTQALINRGEPKAKDQYLFRIVSGFGFNQKFHNYCIRFLRVSPYASLEGFSPFDFMDAIYKMDKKKKYKKLIKDYSNTGYYNTYSKKQEAIIQEFIEIAEFRQ